MRLEACLFSEEVVQVQNNEQCGIFKFLIKFVVHFHVTVGAWPSRHDRVSPIRPLQ